MEYFTLEADRRDIRRFGIIFSSKKVIILGIITLFLLARATGMIKIEYNWLYADGDHQYGREMGKTTFNHLEGTGKIKTANKNDHLNISDKDRNWKAEIHLGGPKLEDCRSEEECLRKAIQRRFRESGELARLSDEAMISVDSLETSGAYWVPFIKNGKASYSISVEERSDRQTFTGHFSGSIDFNVYGICSVGDLQTIISEKIAKTVTETVIKDYKNENLS